MIRNVEVPETKREVDGIDIFERGGQTGGMRHQIQSSDSYGEAPDAGLR